MKTKPYLLTLALGVSGLFLAAHHAQASVIACNVDPTINYMEMSTVEATACLDSGTGNLSGQNHNDLFINNGTTGTGYMSAGKSDEGPNLFNISYTQSGNSGTWNFDSSFWSQYSDAALGFKFGTGNTPDEWFVFSLADGISSGSWDFFQGSSFNKQNGGGLSHMNLYYKDEVRVPEPGTLGLLGLGIISLMTVRRRVSSRH